LAQAQISQNNDKQKRNKKIPTASPGRKSVTENEISNDSEKGKINGTHGSGTKENHNLSLLRNKKP